MASFTVTIPDQIAADVVDALCEAGGWRSQALDGTKASFARAQVTNFVRGAYRTWKADTAAETARAAALSQATTDSSGVSTA